jgi:rSAM/selenodomain-associated transferase 2
LKLSIIIPVLNEAAGLPQLMARIAPQRACGTEIIIVDGGSTDDSPALVRRAGITLIESAPGRARQMNAGAAAAHGETLLFLHADTILPPFADQIISAALGSGAHRWGRFDVSIDGHHWMLPIVAAMMNLRSRLTGIATGDQAIFVTRKAFNAVGGFPDLPLMEDIELSRRLKAQSRPASLRHRVHTSGRRWENRGVWRTIALMWSLRWAWWRGAPAETLARRYR